ncbi:MULTISPECIES: hypothetical protein [Chryseobacterium]|uniref:Uncharacterized protein n=1 Tax=Chryseobacterium gallinarum TaxID=1324352 RepID=A0ABX6KMU1_CHRGL|nr:MULTISPECIES: hypothetical protein [Chryseobacterium]MCL8537196.1 hypothetical protein [Chryseobacterium gallinarum]QIY89119.1 hypothetical protein FOB44_08595 [Chryseobacterium gallinarum]
MKIFQQRFTNNIKSIKIKISPFSIKTQDKEIIVKQTTPPAEPACMVNKTGRLTM